MNNEFHRHPIRYIARNLSIVIGLVLIWRGVWYILDAIDYYIFGDPAHIATAVAGIIVGLLVLFLPDHDLKEIQKL